MGSIKSKIITVGLLILSTMMVRAQNEGSDSVLDKYMMFKDQIDYRLKNYRLLKSTFFRVYYHNCYPGIKSRFYKGVDLSLDGMVDSTMRKRIVQLLNDEYRDGEYDQWVDRLMTRNKYIKISQEEAIEITKEKKWNKCDVYDVIALCGGLKDDEIKSILINIYENKDNEIYDQYRNVTLMALARMGIEPYLSIFIEKYKYNEFDDSKKMETSIKKLGSVPCKETLLEVSKYLSSDKYVIYSIESDSIVGDTIYEDEEIEIVPIVLETYEPTYYPDIYEYIKTTAFIRLAWYIHNPELLAIVGIKRDENLNISGMRPELDAKLTPRKCKKIQRWMQKNYNNYDLTGNW